MARTDTSSAEEKLKPGDRVIITTNGSELHGMLIEDRGVLVDDDGDRMVGVTVGEGEWQSRFQTYASALRRDDTV